MLTSVLNTEQSSREVFCSMRQRVVLGVFAICLVSFTLGQILQGYAAEWSFAHDRSDNPTNPAVLAREQLSDYLNRIAYRETTARAQSVAHIETQGQAKARQRAVRAKVLRLIGGLPSQRTPLHAQSLGTWLGNGYHIERVIYDSLPGFHVTANLYLPEGRGPFAAIISAPGHGANGKLGSYQFAANFARNVIETNLHRNVSESVLPGVLLHFDLPDVVATLGKRVTVTDPIAADGDVISSTIGAENSTTSPTPSAAMPR